MGYIVVLLLIGYVLTLFEFDNIFIKGIEEIFNKRVTIATYYVFFLVVGVLFGLIYAIK